MCESIVRANYAKQFPVISSKEDHDILLNQKRKLQKVESTAYYNGNEPLSIELPRDAATSIAHTVKQSYNDFPNITEEHNNKITNRMTLK